MTEKHIADTVNTAVNAGSFSTLIAAIKMANLVDTLKGKGPFTVFAPTDETLLNCQKIGWMDYSRTFPNFRES